MTVEILYNGIAKRLIADEGKYLTQSAEHIVVQFRVYTKSLTMNTAVSNDTYREADEAEYQQWKIDYQKYLDSLGNEGLLSEPTTEQDI